MQVWKLFPVVADAVESVQPGAQAAAASFVAASAWGSKPEQPPAATVEAEQGMLLQASVGDAGDVAATGACNEADAGSNSSSKDSTAAAGGVGSVAAMQGGMASRKGGSNDGAGLAVLRPSAALEARPRSAVRRVLARAGLGAPQLLPALHFGVLFAAAGSLTVVKAAYLGLGRKADWVAFTGGWAVVWGSGGVGRGPETRCIACMPASVAHPAFAACPQSTAAFDCAPMFAAAINKLSVACACLSLCSH